MRELAVMIFSTGPTAAAAVIILINPITGIIENNRVLHNFSISRHARGLAISSIG